ncbi:MAG: hypothetical protein AUJ75_01190 [Candidatus Omnitrophica bacterium CG1_02_49_10]|nr:MAG: hypothetical protein AUJ75_01190 [Candidatus Omnitrophica bacterium CG1_02_49_10]
MQKKVLGRGLKALIPETSGGSVREVIEYIDVDKIKTSRLQPREKFDDDKLNELMASIKEKGVVQPVLVRRIGGFYELIAGERRLRSVKKLGMSTMPAIIKDVSDTEAFQISLIENLQRENLNAIEEAHGYQRLIDEFEFTQEKIAQAVGKDRSSVANALRLIRLPAEIQELVSRGTITPGHARAIMGFQDPKAQIKFAQLIVNKGLSVREAENHLSRQSQVIKKKMISSKDPHIHQLEEQLQRIVGTKVRITHGKKRGKIQIEYFSPEDLDRILNLFISVAGKHNN